MTNCTFCSFCAVFHQQKWDNREVGQYNHQLHTGRKHGLLGMQECLPSTFQPTLQSYTGSNLRADKPLCRPTLPSVWYAKTNVTYSYPIKIIPTAYMESPRMGPYLPYKPTSSSRKTSHTRTSQSRKTSHPRISQSRKTNHPRTTRSSLFPPYNNSRSAIWRVLTGTLPPLGSRACARPHVCVSARLRVPAPAVCLSGQEDREDSRHTEQDRWHAGSSSPALPHAACPKCLPRLPCLPCLPAMHVFVILSMRASHAHPVKWPFVKPFYLFPI